MRISFMLLLILGFQSVIQAQQFNHEWRGYMATTSDFNRSGWFITGETLWYTVYDIGVEEYNLTTGAQQLSTQSSINYIKEDRNGLTWGIGANNTVYTYQQNQWQIFPVPDSVRNKPVPPNYPDFHHFISIDFDSNGNIWIAALFYVWKYDGQTWTSYDITPSSLNVADFLQYVSVDQNDIVWINNSVMSSYTTLSIVSYDGTSWQNYGSSDFGISLDYLTSEPHIDANNKKWWNLNCANVQHGVPCVDSNLFLTYNDTAWVVVTQSDLNTTYTGMSSIKGNGNNFWTTAGSNALVHYNAGTWTFYDADTYGLTGLSGQKAIDSNNVYWGQTAFNGFSFDGTTANLFKIGVSSFQPNNRGLERSASGKMWWLNGEVGTIDFDKSTTKVEEALQFSTISTPNGLEFRRKYYTVLQEVAPNDVWVANSGGFSLFTNPYFLDTLSLFHYNGTTWSEIKIDTQVAPNTTRITDMVVSNNEVWLTTNSQGLLNWNGSTWTGNYGTPLDSNLSNIVAANTGDIWLSSDNQIFKYNGTTVATFDHTTNNIPDALFRDLHYDQNTGTLWLTTDSAGLVKYDGTTWTTYNTQNSAIATDFLFSIAQAPTGELWIGTRNSGLVYFDGNSTWKTINTNTPNSPMITDLVFTVEVDRNNNVWFFNDDLLLIYQEGGLVNVPTLPKATTAFNSHVYPNPFTSSTNLTYTLERAAQVEVLIYDAQGRIVKTLIQNQPEGLQQLEWRPRNQLPSGVYFYSIKLNNQLVDSGKVLYQAEK